MPLRPSSPCRRPSVVGPLVTPSTLQSAQPVLQSAPPTLQSAPPTLPRPAGGHQNSAHRVTVHRSVAPTTEVIP